MGTLKELSMKTEVVFSSTSFTVRKLSCKKGYMRNDRYDLVFYQMGTM